MLLIRWGGSLRFPGVSPVTPRDTFPFAETLSPVSSLSSVEGAFRDKTTGRIRVGYKIAPADYLQNKRMQLADLAFASLLLSMYDHDFRLNSFPKSTSMAIILTTRMISPTTALGSSISWRIRRAPILENTGSSV